MPLDEACLQAAGLCPLEVSHALSCVDLDYGEEAVLRLPSGRQLRSPAHPEPCSYVRLTIEINRKVVEVTYWNEDEWREAPADVMGAIIGALHGATELAAESLSNSPIIQQD